MVGTFLIKIDFLNEERVLKVTDRVGFVSDLIRLYEDKMIRWDTLILYMSFYDRRITEVRHDHVGLIWYRQPEVKP